MNRRLDFVPQHSPAGAAARLTALLDEYHRRLDSDEPQAEDRDLLEPGLLIERMRALLAGAGVTALDEQDHFLHEYVLPALEDEAEALSPDFDLLSRIDEDVTRACTDPPPDLSPAELLNLPHDQACPHGQSN
jgi:hypothetical protein